MIEGHTIRAGDLLYGVPAIAEFLGLTVRQARHQCEARHLPTFKMGKMVCARRSTLLRWFEEQEANAPTSPLSGRQENDKSA